MIKDDFALEALYNAKFEAQVSASHYYCFRCEGKFSFFDYLVVSKKTGAIIPVELKTDRLAFNTGNLAIEFKRDSVQGEVIETGLSITKAKYWVYNVIGGSQYWIEVEKLKEYIAENNFRVVKGGDGFRTSMHLIPIESLETQSFVTKKTLK